MAGGRRDSFTMRSFVRRIVRVLLILFFVIAAGTSGYVFLEGWSFLDAVYMTVITISTVGFTEVHPTDAAGKLWTMALIISGIATFSYAVGSLVELSVEGAVRGYFSRRRMKREIDGLKGHQIICGYGRIGRQVAREFAQDRVPFVIIDQQPEIVEECLAEGYLAIAGDASDDAVLEEAGVRRAKGLIAAVDSDADNVFVTLSDRKLNPGLRIVARTSSDESAAKLEAAGADRTLSPYAVGGRRLASLATQPLIVDFLDIVTRGREGIEFRLEEFNVLKGSPLADHTIGELRIKERTGATILAIFSGDGRFDTTPTAQDRIRAGDTLIVLGTREQVGRLDRLMRGDQVEDV